MVEKPAANLPSASQQHTSSTAKQTSQASRRWTFPLLAAIGAYALWVSGKHHRHGGPPKKWDHGPAIYRTKNSTVGWHVCPDTPAGVDYQFLCSTLRVPLNWLDPVEGENTEIFFRMLPADEGKRRGSLLVNPGGPGGSGNAFVYGAGVGLKVITNGTLDIVGFDPRGINMTSPRASPTISAFDTDYARGLFDQQYPSASVNYDPSLPYNYSTEINYNTEHRYTTAFDHRSKLERDLTLKRTSERALKSVSTAFVVRDMVALVDALDEPDGLLTYWGYSYGTILGAHFAAMMPDRVGRMVLDGVAHSGDYTNNLFDWAWSSMTDNTNVWGEFCRLCSERGPTRCALATNSTTTAADVEKIVDDLAHALFEKPLPVESSDGGPGFVTITTLYSSMFQALYSPKTWGTVATAIKSAIDGDGTALRNMAGLPSALAHPETGSKKDTDNVFGISMGGTEAMSAILCSDGASENHSVDETIEFTSKLHGRAKIGLARWMSMVRACHSWRDRPFERYSGPWTVTEGLRKTKNKVLWVGNTYDPVTPLRSAERMHEGFGEESSSLLIHEGGLGHCSVATPTLCTINAIQSYLLNGVVPNSGTRCKADLGNIFPSTEGSLSAMSEEDRSLLMATEQVADILLPGRKVKAPRKHVG